MANFDSVKKGSGPTIIGVPKNDSLVASKPVLTPSPTTTSPVQTVQQEPPKLQLPPRPAASNLPVTSNTIPLPPKPEEVQTLPAVHTENNSSSVQTSTRAPTHTQSAYNQLPPLPPKPQQKPDTTISTQTLPPSSTVQETAQSSRTPQQSLPTISNTARSVFLGLDGTQTSNAYTGVPANILHSIALNGADSVTPQTPTADFKIKNRKSFRNLPIVFASVTLVFSLAAAGLTWYLNYSSTPRTQASTQNISQTTGNVAITTYLSNSAVDSDKKEQKTFIVSDPIQICIRYEQQPTNTAMQIKLLREVDGGSQLEITSARINASGTDTRCLPFTGVQAKEGKYTVEVSTASDSTVAFKKVADSTFAITQKAQ